MLETFDVILLGAGQAGNPLSRSLSAAGKRVALIERSEIGGSCVNVGCTPTKTMVASARVAHLARRAAEFGVRIGDVRVQMEDVRRRKNDIVERSRASSERQLQDREGLTLIRGAAAFTGPKAVRVSLRDGGTRDLTAPIVVVNTGCRPARPDLPGLDRVPFLDSTSILDLGEVPEHLIVLGGGYIGLEFAQMFRRFGSRVTIVHRGEQLLRKEDADVAEAIADILREDGIEVLLRTESLRVTGSVELAVRTPDGEPTLTGSHLLIATGRTPNTDDLNLTAAGIAADEKGFIPVNERLETNVEGVFALGDVNGGPAFTHVSHNDNQIFRENLLHHAGRTTHDRLIPHTIFLDPQLGRVGLTEKEAREKGLKVHVAKLPMKRIARAFEIGETRGFLKAVVDAKTDRILGCAALGVEGGEVMAMVQIAMMGNLPYQRLRDDMFAHPTLARGLNALFSNFEGE
ncbi:mercuric reductase [Limnoglobus roseus]|uniref:Mercuric reductase n=1 Tax=Limnoglobus roseus TaxID=2598579 RepID=A0A5C1ABG2_9BACT|nr:mercuric reductase [Limnoglobus roseus]QEL16050.1 mercuric reductase [Limnoglobus roseus]